MRPLRRLRSVHVAGQRVLRGCHERGERRRLVHGELGEHATVHLHTREAEALNEAVVRDAILTGSGVDALDPQATEVALALATVAVGVDEGVGDLLLRLAVPARRLPAVAGRAESEEHTYDLPPRM